MGSASSIESLARATHLQRAPQHSAKQLVHSSQTLPSSGTADPILVLYIYADRRDSVAYATASEFIEQQMPRLCDMAASRGMSLFPMVVDSREQLVDTNDAFGILSERYSKALVAFLSDADDAGIGLPAQLPLAFVHRCIAALKKRQPESAAFLSDIFKVSPPPSSLMSCLSHGRFVFVYFFLHTYLLFFIRIAGFRLFC